MFGLSRGRGVVQRVFTIRYNSLSKLTGLARATIYKKVSDGSFPAPIRPGARSVGWRLSEVVDWLQAPERRWDPSEVK